MKRLFAILVLTTLLCGIPTFTYSQISFQLGGGAGLAIPTADYAGSTTEYYQGINYGLASGFNLHAKARVNLVGFRLAGELAYASLSNDGEAEPGQGRVEVSHKIFSIKVGPEFHLAVPMMPLTPYFGANVALNGFSGETIFQGVSKVPSGTFTMESTTRLGVGFSAGTLISLGPLTSLDIGIAYNIMNLSGKKWDDVYTSRDDRVETYLALNDDKDPFYQPTNDKHVVSGSRTINTIQVTASLMFGL